MELKNTLKIMFLNGLINDFKLIISKIDDLDEGWLKFSSQETEAISEMKKASGSCTEALKLMLEGLK